MSENVTTETTKHDVGDGCMMTDSEIAEETGLSRQAVRKRRLAGKVGAELLEPAQDKAAASGSAWTIFKRLWADAEEEGFSGGVSCGITFTAADQKKWKANGYRSNHGEFVTPNGGHADWLPKPRGWTI